ncbi:unnamed protein product [Rotaria magnacalcarata]
MSEEKQLVVFTKDDRDQIATIVRELQPNEDSIAFRELSQTINVATGMLPQKVIPTVLQLCAAYSETLKNLAHEKGANKGTIGSLEYEIQVFTNAVKDANSAKIALQTERNTLTNLIPEYQRQVALIMEKEL